MQEVDAVSLQMSAARQVMIFMVQKRNKRGGKEKVQLTIHRNASGSGNVSCHIFILADAQLNIMNKELEGVKYYLLTDWWWTEKTH